MIALILFAAIASSDDAVTNAALASWQRSMPAGVTIKLAPERYALKNVGIATFSAKLVESGASMNLAQNFFFRNPDKEGWLPRIESDTAKVRMFRVASPGFDESQTHALILGGSDRSTIYLATLEKKDGAWRTTWTSTMKPMRETAPPPPIPDGLTPLRVGGDVKAPVVVKRVEPIVPAGTRIFGLVILEVIIDKTGRVRSVNVLKPLPGDLDDIVAGAVKQWEFRPGTLNGVPVDVIYNITYSIRPQ